MNARIHIATLLLLSAGAACVSHPDKKTVEAGAPVDDPAMAKMMEYGTPGPAHEVLRSKVGKWKAVVKTYMEPGKEPEVSQATSEVRWVLDGRYIEDTFTGSVMGQPFQGRGLTGYDNLGKKYVSTWIDSMSTGIMVSEGSYDAATKTFTYTGQAPDALSGQYVKTRLVDRELDADHSTFQMYMPGPDGKEALTMEIRYTRAK